MTLKNIEKTAPALTRSRRIQREMKTITAMITIYCRAHHHTGVAGVPLCTSCNTLREYAIKRLDNCPFKENKTTCSHCAIHCYNETMKKRVIQVMRFSGPRMLLHHPILAVYHLIDEKKRTKAAVQTSSQRKGNRKP